MKITHIRTIATIALLAWPLAAGTAQSGPMMSDTASKPAKPTPKFILIRDTDVLPDHMLPTPPAKGSPLEGLEMAQLRTLIANTSPERMTQARWDADHEDPAIFDAVVGVSLKTLPATWELLRAVQNDANIAANRSKVHFQRIRPWGVDPALPNCDAGSGKKPVGSYPSGHSSLSYSVGFILADLVPAKAQAILDRASDYSLSREICGVHFASDGEASHVIGTAVATRFLLAPSMATKIAAARAELAAATR